MGSLDSGRNILVVNAGSSNIKLSLFALREGNLVETWREKIGLTDQGLLNDCLAEKKDIFAVGHRIVHGGNRFQATTEIGKQMLDYLRSIESLAPQHLPISIKAIETTLACFSKARQVAAFDTAFHSTLDLKDKVYPLPFSWYQDLGIRRFGFHGISHRYCAAKAADFLGSPPSELKIINCHLGNGASICAIKNGKSINTSMGFTPLDGIMMGTRGGSIDPGIILHLLENERMSLPDLKQALNKDSGLKGICGYSNMEEVERAILQGNDLAKLAFEMYVAKVAATIASFIPQLGGLDVLSFSGGVGENSANLRSAVCEKLNVLAVEIDLSLNEKTTGNPLADCLAISPAGSRMKTLVIKSDENLAIAQEILLLYPV